MGGRGGDIPRQVSIPDLFCRFFEPSSGSPRFSPPPAEGGGTLFAAPPARRGGGGGGGGGVGGGGGGVGGGGGPLLPPPPPRHPARVFTMLVLNLAKNRSSNITLLWMGVLRCTVVVHMLGSEQRFLSPQQFSLCDTSM
jgi:hypothetical protein